MNGLKNRMRIFVSYTLRDKQLDVNKLRRLSIFLSTYGYTFIDCINNNSRKKQERVIEEVKKCDCFLLLLTSKTFESEWVQVEIQLAKKENKKILETYVNHDIDYTALLNIIKSFRSKK